MGVVIKRIQLKNWFGYNGEYDDNTFEFSDGVNIVVATNDVGKSKLHNAFRWIIEDKVILKNIETNKHEIVKINIDNIEEVLNHFEKAVLKNGETTTLGVKLTYEIKNSHGESKIRILTKEIVCKKDVKIIKSSEPIYKVEKVERGNVRSISEGWDESIRNLMRNNLKDYFLVQGENVENLTALKGKKLAETINLLVGLDALDKKHDTAVMLSNSVGKLKDDFEKRDNKSNKIAHESIQRKHELEKEIKELEEVELIEIEEFIIDYEKTVKQYSTSAVIAKENKYLRDKIQGYHKDINSKEGELKNQYKNFVDYSINNSFWISKLTENKSEKEIITTSSLKIGEYLANRRAELDNSLDKKEQLMLVALQKEQPNPVVLEQMIKDGHCYVCSQDLNSKSEKYIREKLIPYFKNELDFEDEEFNLLTEVNDLFKKASGYLSKYETKDIDYISFEKDKIIKLQENIFEIEDELAKFIDINGSPEDNGDESISLATYSEALVELNERKKEKEKLLALIVRKKDELSKIRINTIKDKVSKEFIQAEKLYEFSELLNNCLLKFKNDEYVLFCKKLEDVSNKKWQAFTKSNKGLRDQSIKVNYTINSARKPEFEIKVIDNLGNNSHQGGGASQAIRQLSVIFGLIEIANGNVNYPFIADAPTSNTTLALTQEFFNYQLKNAENQNILITKELWDDNKNDLNDVGYSLLNKVQKDNNASFFTIKNGDNKKKIIKKI